MLIVFTGHRDAVTDPAILHALEAEYPHAVWIHGGGAIMDEYYNFILQGTSADYPPLSVEH